MRIYAYKNENEKAHTFSRRSKNIKKNGQKRIQCKFSFSNNSNAINETQTNDNINIEQHGVILQLYSIRDPNVMLEVEYPWNGWVKKNGVNANLVLCD